MKYGYQHMRNLIYSYIMGNALVHSLHKHKFIFQVIEDNQLASYQEQNIY